MNYVSVERQMPASPGVSSMTEEQADSFADPWFFTRYSRTELTAWSECRLRGAGRLLFPMAFNVKADRYVAIEWGHCFNLIAEAARATCSRREQVAVKTSAFLSRLIKGEAAMLRNPPDGGTGDHIDEYMIPGCGWSLPDSLIAREIRRAILRPPANANSICEFSS